MTCRRGTSNGNARGSSRDRAVRRRWLVATFRADVDAEVYRDEDGNRRVLRAVPRGEGEPACRCYRCGRLLIADDTVTPDVVSPDRVKPGCDGGTYARNNIRPACVPCQSTTGGELSQVRRRRSTTPPLKEERSA